MDLTPLVARDLDVRVALIDAFGFGGQNSAIIIRRWDES
jgi:3-oxoacyl-(acyl-carrier-protein) synthase